MDDNVRRIDTILVCTGTASALTRHGITISGFEVPLPLQKPAPQPLAGQTRHLLVSGRPSSGHYLRQRRPPSVQPTASHPLTFLSSWRRWWWWRSPQQCSLCRLDRLSLERKGHNYKTVNKTKFIKTQLSQWRFTDLCRWSKHLTKLNIFALN